MAVIIPIKDNPNHTLLMELESKIYKLGFKFNTIGLFWTLDIWTENDELLLAGVKMVANYPLIFYHKNKSLPTGDFICEISDINSRIVRDSFSSGKAKFLYLTAAELAAM